MSRYCLSLPARHARAPALCLSVTNYWVLFAMLTTCSYSKQSILTTKFESVYTFLVIGINGSRRKGIHIQNSLSRVVRINRLSILSSVYGELSKCRMACEFLRLFTVSMLIPPRSLPALKMNTTRDKKLELSINF